MTSSVDVKMSNWKATEIREMQALLGLCSCQLAVRYYGQYFQIKSPPLGTQF